MRRLHGDRISEVDLVGVAGLDVSLDTFYLFRVIGLRDVESGFGREAVRRGFDGSRRRCVAEEYACGVIEDKGLRIGSEPGDWLSCRRVAVQTFETILLEVITALVVKIAGKVKTLRMGCVQTSEEGGEIVQRVS